MWTFFQARTVRQTVVRTAAEGLDAQYKDAADAPAAVRAQIEQWRKTAQRHDTEPETNEGSKELMARAKMHEARREEARAAHHLFEYGSAAFQLAAVLASASALTAVAWLAFVSGGLGSSARPSRSWASSRRRWSPSRVPISVMPDRGPPGPPHCLCWEHATPWRFFVDNTDHERHWRPAPSHERAWRPAVRHDMNA
jgi:hypothetical protein